MMNDIVWHPGMTLEDMEQAVIVRALKTYGNKAVTAQRLGIAVRTLDARLEKYAADEKARKAKADEQRERDLQFLDKCRNGRDSRFASRVPSPPAETKAAPVSPEAEAGDGAQPSSESPPQQPVSLPQRQEVQGMPPAKAAAGGQRRTG